MNLRILSVFAVTLFAWPAEKKLAVGETSNESVAIRATAYLEKDDLKQLLGSDLGGTIVVVEVVVTPKTERELAISRDDFWLLSEKDGQKSQPFAPSQIAGRGALVVSSTSGGASGMMNDRGPVWGGIGDRPRRLGGDDQVISATKPGASATVNDGSKQPEDPLLAVLKQKVLPEKKSTDPVSGLLYFQMEGKHKPKQLELTYRGPAGKLALRFR
jgi:hypothetical protein